MLEVCTYTIYTLKVLSCDITQIKLKTKLLQTCVDLFCYKAVGYNDTTKEEFSEQCT